MRVMRAFVTTFGGVSYNQPRSFSMSVQLLVIYPPPKDLAEFDRAYREEHLPFAGPRLVGATGVKTKRVLGAPGGKPLAHWISVVDFPNAEVAKACAQSKGGREAL